MALQSGEDCPHGSYGVGMLELRLGGEIAQECNPSGGVASVRYTDRRRSNFCDEISDADVPSPGVS